MDNQQRPNEGLRELALFAGAGGGILGGKLLGWRTVCAVEWEPYPASVLAARQNDGILPPFPIWDDVRTFDGKPWRGRVDVVSGGFPCQDISCAGKGAGIDGERSGMWVEMARVVREVGPRFVFVENSPMLTSRGLGRVLGDLAEMGYDARWGVLGARHCGGNIYRDRIWVLACARENGWVLSNKPEINGAERKRRAPTFGRQDWDEPKMVPAMRRELDKGWQHLPHASRDIDDVAAWVDRLAATGNGQVPAVAALAWRILSESTP